MDPKRFSGGRAPAPGANVRLADIARRAMRERGFAPEFSAAVLKETTAAVAASAESNTSIRDLGTLPWVSIDNDNSLDLDQLSVAQPMVGGAVKILVAIADVDAVVKQDTAIDVHAQFNTTSVYTASAVFPMLPERLSTDLTCLRQDVERLALVVEMAVAADGTVSESAVYRAVVRNHAKLAYNSVAAWLDGGAPAPARIAAVAGLDEQLRVQDRVARAMNLFRHTHGALSLETIEARPVFEGDALTDIQLERTNRAKQLIENFMIAANGVVAKFLAQKGSASLRRQLRTPERWDRIVALAANLGGHLPAEPSASALEEFLAAQRKIEPAKFSDLSLSVVKLLGRGEYVLEVPGTTADGHFALAMNDYTHSTAPNRRFSDLVTQRLLKAADSGRATPYSNDQLAQFGRHCTEQETNAAKVERQVRKSAAALLLEPRVGEVFDAIVTGASQKGTWVQIAHPLVEGKLVRAFAGLNVGDRIRARLLHTDAELGFIDFARA